ncbi:unnamed protein product [Rhizophagus irregularis]|nr:unnamed protein product [Rhizophagus irregularis]
MIKVLWIASLEKVQVERYNNSSNHTYSLLEIDRIKRPKVIRDLVEVEAAKNYSPPAITSAVKEYTTLELNLGECARELKRKEVTNIKYKVRGPMETHLIGNLNLKLDISESISYLKEQGYFVKNYRILQRSTKGFVFVHPEQLKKLECHRWLTLMDSTHKTNRSEDADTVSQALTIIRNMCRWSPHYILSDHSNIEANGIKKAFPDISASEQECEVLLCVVHVMRMWIQRIHEKKLGTQWLWRCTNGRRLDARVLFRMLLIVVPSLLYKTILKEIMPRIWRNGDYGLVNTPPYFYKSRQRIH